MKLACRVHAAVVVTTCLRRLASASFALVLVACGGSSTAPAPQASSSDIAVGAAVPGPTPFISVLPLSGQSLKQVSIYRFLIAPKPGTVSRPVDVRYSAAAMARRGFHADGSSSANLPVFGLYAGHANQVTLEMTFGDGSRQEKVVTITTPPYVDPAGIFDHPTILQARASGGPSLNYALLRSVSAGPIVVDSDAQVRWTAPGTFNGRGVVLRDNALFLAGQTSLDFYRIELDGALTKMLIPAQAPSNPQAQFDHFHHSLDRSRSGILGELDGVVDGIPSIESMIVDLSLAGAILKDWDMAAIVRKQMRDNGDDPALFVRPGSDWFHMNATTYDARDNSVIVSSRENFVIKIDYASGAIKWILGDPTKYWYTFPSLRAKALTLEAGGLYPVGQHAVSIASDGSLLLFNNGTPSVSQPAGAPLGEKRLYSVVSAYDIDPVKMTAREIWNFDYGKTILSDICSSVYEVPGGGYLLSYAAANNRTRARIVGIDSRREVLFDFDYPSPGVCETSFSAEPIGLDKLTIQ
ncbi:MAG TPA: aryl-sulfate sulfotransferase [Telluria sp.]